ncbi:limonene-1,2-epoxide hydrolase family protein [Mycobacterium sp.]|uniref:limonene-1,2-epoxide hydrolase family protein n=1 Tax=Mycobacterium sp. TaxID=1785 RepID=UPI003C78D3B6
MGNEEKAVRQMCELWGVPDADGMVAMFAEDGVYHNIPEEPMAGREAIRSWLQIVCAQVRVEADVLHLACDGEWVLSERLDTHVLGDKRIPLPVMNISRVVDGKLALWRDYYDTQMVRNLGLVAD